MKVKGEWLKRGHCEYENDVGHWVRRGPRGPCFLTDAIKRAQRPEEAVRGLLPPRYLLGALLGSKEPVMHSDLASRCLSSDPEKRLVGKGCSGCDSDQQRTD